MNTRNDGKHIQVVPDGGEWGTELVKCREQRRLKYLPPQGIRVLFVAEAPPEDPERFFYLEDVKKFDWLYLSLIRLLYEDASGTKARELRRCKREFLERFQADGYYLVDASSEPMPAKSKRKTKEFFLTGCLDAFQGKLRGLTNPETRIVLISRAVHSVCFAPLKAAGFNVINTEMIDFPASGRQRAFRDKLSRLLCDFLPSSRRC